MTDKYMLYKIIECNGDCHEARRCPPENSWVCYSGDDSRWVSCPLYTTEHQHCRSYIDLDTSVLSNNERRYNIAIRLYTEKYDRLDLLEILI